MTWNANGREFVAVRYKQYALTHLVAEHKPDLVGVVEWPSVRQASCVSKNLARDRLGYDFETDKEDNQYQYRLLLFDRLVWERREIVTKGNVSDHIHRRRHTIWRLRRKSTGQDYLVFLVHLPHKKKQFKNQSIRSLKKDITDIPGASDCVIVMGDFNQDVQRLNCPNLTLRALRNPGRCSPIDGVFACKNCHTQRDREIENVVEKVHDSFDHIPIILELL